MKTPVLHQTVRTEDDAYLFAVPAMLLATVLTIGALTLMLGTIPTEPVPAAAAAPVSEPLTTFVGA